MLNVVGMNSVLRIEDMKEFPKIILLQFYLKKGEFPYQVIDKQKTAALVKRIYFSNTEIHKSFSLEKHK